jgi:hypothetical protein
MQVSSFPHRFSFVGEIFFLKLGNDPDLLSEKCRMKRSLMVFVERPFPCEFSVKLTSCWLVGTQTTNRTPAMVRSPPAVVKRMLHSSALLEVLLLYIPKEMAGLKDGSTILILRMLISVIHQLSCHLYVCVSKCYNILSLLDLFRPITLAYLHQNRIFTSFQSLYQLLSFYVLYIRTPFSAFVILRLVRYNRSDASVQRRQLTIGLKDIHKVLHWRGITVTPVEAMKAYRGSVCIAPRIRNLGSRWRL